MPNCCRRALMVAALVLSAVSSLRAQCNDYDLMLLCDSATAVDGIVSEIGLDCAFNPTPEQCFIDAATEDLPTMSIGCITCFGGQANCAIDNCATICAFGTAAACDVCITSNCQVAFEACAGIVDADNDTHNNICDCDDNNPDQYPGAPGTAEGIDNNCNGLMEVSEFGDPVEPECVGDFNGDNLVGAADLVNFLGYFGCMVDCGDQDLDADGLVGVSDLVILLGLIGIFC